LTQLVEVHAVKSASRAAVLGALVVAALTATITGWARQPALDPIGPIQKVRNNLFVITGQGGNTAVFVTRTGVVLVDTKLVGNGQAILDRVAAVSDLPVTTIVNTHAHPDHVGGNEFFSPTVDVVTHESAKTAMVRDKSLEAAPHALPDRTFSSTLTLGQGPDRVELFYFGRGHTGGDAVAVFPAVRAMHAGDLFPWKGAPLIDASAGGSGVSYPDTLDRLLAGVKNVDLVLPGHGAPTTWAALTEFSAFVHVLVETARAAHAAGRTGQQAAADLPARFAAYADDAAIPGLEAAGSRRALAAAAIEAINDELK
jgi:glyoxylase-like metal-dependent hydrolase (beta-lactamase superfamily II)